MFTALSRRVPVWAVSLLVLWAMNAQAQHRREQPGS